MVYKVTKDVEILHFSLNNLGPPWKLRKSLGPKRRVLFSSVTVKSVIHIQDLKQVYFVTSLRYEDLRETGN